MPNIKSAIKRVSVTEKKTAENKVKKSEMRTVVKKAKLALEQMSSDAQEKLKEAQQSLDRAASKGLLHKKTAARRKSRLTKAFNASANN